ncbi:MAG: SpoIIE family protein phosphatase [Ruminococcus sp.]
MTGMKSMEAVRTRKTKKQDLNFTDLTKSLIMQGVYFLLGLLVSRGAVLGELSPFGASLVAGVPLRFMAASVAGSSLGYILLSPMDSFRYIAVLAAIGALKWLLSDFGKISKSQLFAPALAFLPMLLTGVALLFVSSSKFSDVTMCLIEALLSAAGAYFISRTVALSAVKRSINSFSQSEVACLAVTFCILMLSLGSVSVLGISVGRVLAVIAVLLCAQYGSVAFGSISGIATGVVFSLGNNDMAFLSGSYAFAGLVAGLFSTLGKLPVGMAFTVTSTLMSVASGDGSLVLSLFIEALLASGLFMLIPKSFGNTLRSVFIGKNESLDETLLRRSITARLEHTSKALSGVTECVTAVSEKLSKNLSSQGEYPLFQQVSEKTCKNCGLRAYCLDRQREVTIDDFSRLQSILEVEGFVTDRDIESTFTKKCCKQRELAKSINESFREYLSALSAERRISQVRAAVAGQFSGLSVMLSDLSEEFESCESFDRESTERIAEAFKNQGIVLIDSSVRRDSQNRLSVELIMARGSKKLPDRTELQQLVADCCGRRFERAVESIEGDRVRFVMSELSTYDVDIGSSQHIAGAGKLCGDSLTYFANGMGSMVAIVSDGMGTGGAAAVDSNMAVSIFTKLLKAGLSYDSALSVVNSSLMIKSEEESMATVDIADIDLYSGKLSLFKAGAPLTLVKRAGRILRREFPSLPVGILSGVKFRKDNLTLHEGDAVLMISDGALSGDDKWLEDMLRSWNEASAQDFASIVVNEAIKRRNDGYDDDITAIAVKLIAN